MNIKDSTTHQKKTMNFKMVQSLILHLLGTQIYLNNIPIWKHLVSQISHMCQLYYDYKQTWFCRRFNWLKCSHWLKVMSTLIWKYGMKNMFYFSLVHMIKATFLAKYQFKHLVKRDKQNLKRCKDDQGLIKSAILIWPLIRPRPRLSFWHTELTYFLGLNYLPNIVG
jgi:hypothetical protein